MRGDGEVDVEVDVEVEVGAVVDSWRMRMGLWCGWVVGVGRVDGWKKRRWVGVDEAAWQGVRSLGCGFRPVSAVRRGRVWVWGVSMLGVFAVGGVGEVCLYFASPRAHGLLELWEIGRFVRLLAPFAPLAATYICLGALG